MKKLKKLLVPFALFAGIALGMYAYAPVMNFLEGEEVVFERPAAQPTEFELWVASEEVKAELELMFKRHKRDELNEQITELESKR